MGVVYAAYDPELDRKVALKMLLPSTAGDSESTGRIRMIREAQALAKLSHPNVVAVYDVGTAGDSIWIAMELVTGRTLGAWALERSRSWPEILKALTEAARGVVAAHAAGVIHRDLKPDNVMVDRDGRVRVMDFGLAHGRILKVNESDLVSTLSADTKVQPELAALALRLTTVGSLQGTPAYMSPEQHHGGTCSPFSDQFSFSVTLYEALYGVRPFRGDTREAIREQIDRGPVPPPPAESRVPRWLFKIVARGLARRPEQRWPSLDDMLAALAHDPRHAWLRAATVVGLLAAATLGGYAATVTHTPAAERCSAAAREIAAVWSPARRVAVARAFVATGAPFAADAWRRVDHRLDAYSTAWARERAAACEAHAAGLQSPALLDLRTACLERRKLHMSALIDLFTTADREVVQHAVQAVASLPGVQACSDADGLLAGAAPPDDPQTAASVAALRDTLARSAALEATGGYAQGLELVTQVRAEAQSLGHAPLTAEAALIEGTLLMAAARPSEAAPALATALRLAIAHDLHAIAAEAAARRLFVVGDGLGEPTAALATQPFAEALVERARDDGRLAALLANNLGTVFDLGGDKPSARVHYERTIALLRSAELSDPLLAVAHHNLASLDLESGDLEAARRNSTRAYELFAALLGEQHPLVAHPLASLGDVALRQGALAEASERYTQALDLMEATHGPGHPYLVHPLLGLGHVAARRGDTAEARQRYAQVVTLAGTLDLVHRQRAEALEGLVELPAAAADRVVGSAESPGASLASLP